jgi:hypothetical protein
MKTFKEYLTESKKVYSFKIKVAGDLPEKFEENLKTKLERCKVLTFEKVSTTPVQALPLDFPTLTNKEVHIFNVVFEYPVTSPEIVEDVKAVGVDEAYLRVRNSGEPTEVEQETMGEILNPDGLLTDSEYKEQGPSKVKHKDYFGAEFNKSFLKDLEKAAKTRKKDNGEGEYKLPKGKTDKAGTKSALGS